MSGNRAQSQYLRIFTPSGSDHHLWQNFYVNQTVTYLSKSYRYFPFFWGGIGESAAIGDQTVELVMPATSFAIGAFQNAFSSQHLCELKAYEFDSRAGGLASPLSTQAEIGSFVGYIDRMGGTLTELSVTLGSNLAPVGAQIPSRTANSNLTGIPPIK